MADANFVEHRDRLIATIRELLTDWSDGPPANWENQSVPDYLEALAAWLADCPGYYGDRGVPADVWVVVADALRAAAVYE